MVKFPVYNALSRKPLVSQLYSLKSADTGNKSAMCQDGVSHGGQTVSAMVARRCQPWWPDILAGQR